jgi:hypothetical protein
MPAGGVAPPERRQKPFAPCPRDPYRKKISRMRLENVAVLHVRTSQRKRAARHHLKAFKNVGSSR